MLTQLSVKNVALVDTVELELDEGLTVLTGETGAGKSVLVHALSLLLGGRGSAEIVRSGSDEAIVEGLFLVRERSVLAARLADRGIEVEDGELLVRRVVGPKKSRVFLNGQLATVSMLQEILRGQLDVTGQHEHVSLLDADVHLSLLDRWAGLESQLAEVAERYRRVLGYRTMLDELDVDEGRKAQREDYLRFAIDEIRAIDPGPDELEELERRRQRLRHAEELAEALTAAETTLYSGDGAVVELFGRVERTLRRARELDPELSSEADAAEELRVRTEELARALDHAQRGIEHDPEALTGVDERIDQLRRLVRKYGGTIDATREALATMEEELDQLEHEEVRRADLMAALEAESDALLEVCAQLRRERQQAARALEAALEQELADLALADSRIGFRFHSAEEPGPRGTETVEIEITPNRGETPRPLKKIASGGELSRVLLAFKRALADRAPAQSYVFDEVDTGIGGAVAEVLGRKLREVSRTGQVICVTHLPQVAAQADTHILVEKAPGRDGRLLTRLRRLGADERVHELARMLGGVRITDKVRSAAEEMLTQAATPSRSAGRKRTRRDRPLR